MATGATNNAATLASLQTMLANVNNIAAANGTAGGGTTPATGTGTGTGATAVNNATGTAEKRDEITPTGKLEMRVVNGQTKYYNAQGKAISAFQYTSSHTFQVKLDNRQGISVGLSNLSKTLAARQERVKLLSNALANDANTTGSFSPSDLQMMSMESTTTQQLSELEKKIFDAMRDSIQAWLR